MILYQSKINRNLFTLNFLSKCQSLSKKEINNKFIKIKITSKLRKVIEIN